MPTFLNLLVLFLELSGRCGAFPRRSCGNVTFGVDVGVLCIKRSVSSVTKKHEDGRSTKKPSRNVVLCNTDCWCGEKKVLCAFKFAPSRHAFDLHTFLRLIRALCLLLVVEGRVVRS